MFYKKLSFFNFHIFEKFQASITFYLYNILIQIFFIRYYNIFNTNFNWFFKRNLIELIINL